MIDHARQTRASLLKTLLLGVGIIALLMWAWQRRSFAFAAGWNLYLLPGTALALLSIGVYALRFRRVMRVVGLDLEVIEAVRINTFAMFCHFFVPFAAGADLTKFVKLRGLAPERRAVVGAAGIVLEHFVGLATLIAISLVLMVTLRPIPLDVDITLLALVAVLVMMVGGIIVIRRQNGAHLDIRRLLAQLRQHKLDVACAMGLSLLMQLLLAAAVYVGSQGWGLGVGYWQVLFVLASAFVFQAVPANLVGVGVADLAGTGLYLALGLPLSAAVLLVSLLYGYRLLVALLGGVWEMQAARRAVVATVTTGEN